MVKRNMRNQFVNLKKWIAPILFFYKLSLKRKSTNEVSGFFSSTGNELQWDMSVKTIDFGWADMGSDSMSKCRFQFISCRSSNVVGIKCLSLRSAHFKPRIVFRKIERRNSHFMALRNLISQTSFSIISVNCAFRFKVTSKNHRLKP